MHIIYKLGSLPTEIGNLNKLVVLSIASNRYSGEICSYQLFKIHLSRSLL